jgi:tetratricopeptide (TPR) repeat protein
MLGVTLRSLLALLLIAASANLAFGAATPQLPRSEHKPQPTIEEQLELIGARMMEGDVESALSEGAALLQRPEFKASSDDFRYRALLALGMLEAHAGSAKQGQAYLDEAATISPDRLDAGYWQLYAVVAKENKNHDGAAVAMTEVARQNPKLLAQWEGRFAFGILRNARKSSPPEIYHELAGTLWTAGFDLDDDFISLDPIWIDLLENYISEGRPDAAAAVADGLRDANSLAALSYDLRLSDYARADVYQAYRDARQAEIADGKALVDEHPRDASKVMRVASDLADFNRLDEGLALLDGAIGRADAALGKPAFDDEEDYLAWLHNIRARILMKLGRWEEAITAQIKSRDISNSYQPGEVSQSVNLGDFYYVLGEADKALEAVAQIDTGTASAFGMSAIKEVEACAYHQNGDAAKSSAAVEFLVANVDVNFQAAKLALLCVGDVDRLAGIVISRLEDPGTRREMLSDLQVYMPPPARPEITVRMDELYAGLSRREDVKAALETTGRILQWPAFRAGT